ncbi:MAG: hypothetical protein ACK5UG_11430 [Synechococcaceae cyanobacterium]
MLKARQRDATSLNQAHKMRASCAYGLERFWGEHLRLKDKEPDKAAFVGDVWKALVGILQQGGISLPGTLLASKDAETTIQGVAEQIWRLRPEQQQVALAVLTGLCDSVVWWTQRLKTSATGAD